MSTILIENGREIGGTAEPKPDLVPKSDLTSIFETGTTASQAISAGTYFYLNGTLVRAIATIESGATFTLNTNYEVVTAGALNEFIAQLDNLQHNFINRWGVLQQIERSGTAFMLTFVDSNNNKMQVQFNQASSSGQRIICYYNGSLLWNY